jgi:hypothetical protein
MNSSDTLGEGTSGRSFQVLCLAIGGFSGCGEKISSAALGAPQPRAVGSELAELRVGIHW